MCKEVRIGLKYKTSTSNKYKNEKYIKKLCVKILAFVQNIRTCTHTAFHSIITQKSTKYSPSNTCTRMQKTVLTSKAVLERYMSTKHGSFDL